MQTSDIILEISFIVNFALIALLLFTIYPKVVAWYKKRKKQRERLRNYKIQKIVRDYLKELQK